MEATAERDHLTPEVRAAVNDVMYGTQVSSHVEWLQREFLQLMKREAEWKHTELALRSELKEWRKLGQPP